MRSKVFLSALLAFWLAFGPVANALAQSADTPCESMGMSMSADDCCNGGADQASCLNACLAASAAMSASDAHRVTPLSGHAIVVAPAVHRASILAPPDIAPPKRLLS